MVEKTNESKNSSPASPERRSFLFKVWVALGLVALAEFIAVGISFFVSARKGKVPDLQVQLIDAGEITEFPPGTVTFIHAGNCYLSHLETGGMLAISRKCTHLGCAVPWIADQNQFECPCHASTFDVRGNVINSPAPRALDLYPVSFEKNKIRIDIGHSIRRTSFSADQLFYPPKLG